VFEFLLYFAHAALHFLGLLHEGKDVSDSFEHQRKFLSLQLQFLKAAVGRE
jgi:hypothetical protein